MEKALFQNYDADRRREMLADNAVSCEEKTFMKMFDADQLATRKEALADISVKINVLEQKIKDYKEEINVDLKPLKADRERVIADIKAKGEQVTEKCYKMVDEEEGMVYFYSGDGFLRESRPATREELQPMLFKLNAKGEERQAAVGE